MSRSEFDTEEMLDLTAARLSSILEEINSFEAFFGGFSLGVLFSRMAAYEAELVFQDLTRDDTPEEQELNLKMVSDMLAAGRINNNDN